MKKAILTWLAIFSATALAVTAKVGENSPDFNVMGADGKPYKLSQYKGKVVVLEWFNNDCPYVNKFYSAKKMQEWQKSATDKGVVWLSIISSASGKEGAVDAKGANQIYSDRGMHSSAILLDSKGEVGKLYGAKTTPHMFVIDKSGRLAYMGAIDDRPSAQAKTLDGAQNYVLAALTSLEKGEPVATSSTTPYGCSVKY